MRKTVRTKENAKPAGPEYPCAECRNWTPLAHITNDDRRQPIFGRCPYAPNRSKTTFYDNKDYCRNFERPTRREILELENTEYDYGHDVPKWTNDGE